MKKTIRGMILLPIFFLLSLLSALIYSAEYIMGETQVLFKTAEKMHDALAHLEQTALDKFQEKPLFCQASHHTLQKSTSDKPLFVKSANEPLQLLQAHQGQTFQTKHGVYYFVQSCIGHHHQLIAMTSELNPGVYLVYRFSPSAGMISQRYVFLSL